MLTQPMAKRLKVGGVTYLIGKIKFKLLFHGPLAELVWFEVHFESFGFLF